MWVRERSLVPRSQIARKSPRRGLDERGGGVLDARFVEHFLRAPRAAGVLQLVTERGAPGERRGGAAVVKNLEVRATGRAAEKGLRLGIPKISLLLRDVSSRLIARAIGITAAATRASVETRRNRDGFMGTKK